MYNMQIKYPELFLSFFLSFFYPCTKSYSYTSYVINIYVYLLCMTLSYTQIDRCVLNRLPVTWTWWDLEIPVRLPCVEPLYCSVGFFFRFFFWGGGGGMLT